VAKPGSVDLGTVVEVSGQNIKVKWDSGQTSYFAHGKNARVQMEIIKTPSPPFR
jgi:hypothetical protein